MVKGAQWLSATIEMELLKIHCLSVDHMIFALGFIMFIAIKVVFTWIKIALERIVS